MDLSAANVDLTFMDSIEKKRFFYQKYAFLISRKLDFRRNLTRLAQVSFRSEEDTVRYNKLEIRIF